MAKKVEVTFINYTSGKCSSEATTLTFADDVEYYIDEYGNLSVDDGNGMAWVFCFGHWQSFSIIPSEG